MWLIGIFWENRTQPMTATEVFASGAKVDVTPWVQWSTSDETVLAIDDAGLATVLVDHGVLEIRARDPQHPPSTAVATTATIVKVTQWRHPIWEMGEEYKDAVLEYATGNVYLDNVQFTSNSMSWEWAPRPWVPFPNTVSGFLWAFWSEDGGLTYHGVMWDYITNNHTGKPRSPNHREPNRVQPLLLGKLRNARRSPPSVWKSSVFSWSSIPRRTGLGTASGTNAFRRSSDRSATVLPAGPLPAA